MFCSVVPINNKIDPALSASKDSATSPPGLNIRTTSLDRQTKITVAPSGASSAAMKVIASDNDIKYGGPVNAGSARNGTSSASGKVAGVDLQYAAVNAQKSGTPEASPRRGNLAFYDVEQNIKGTSSLNFLCGFAHLYCAVSDVSHDEDLDSGNTSAMLSNVHKATSSARNSPTRMVAPPMKRDNSNVSTGSAGGNGNGVSSSMTRDSPNRMTSGKQHSAGSTKVPPMSGGKSGKQNSSDLSSQLKGGIAGANDEEAEEKPVDTRLSGGSFVKLGRQLSYRNTTIIDDEKNVPIKVYEVTTTTATDTLKADGDLGDEDDEDGDGEHTKHTRRVSRANIKAANSQPYEAGQCSQCIVSCC